MKPFYQRGFTVVEVVVYIIILVMVLGMVISVFLGMRKSQEGMHRLDIFHDLRSTSRAITDELAAGTKILYPPKDGKKYHHLFFFNRTNQVEAIFLNPQGQLLKLNCDLQKAADPDALRILAQKSIEFTVSRDSDTYLNFTIRILDTKGFEFVLANGISLKNITH